MVWDADIVDRHIITLIWMLLCRRINMKTENGKWMELNGVNKKYGARRTRTWNYVNKGWKTWHTDEKMLAQWQSPKDFSHFDGNISVHTIWTDFSSSVFDEIGADLPIFALHESSLMIHGLESNLPISEFSL